MQFNRNFVKITARPTLPARHYCRFDIESMNQQIAEVSRAEFCTFSVAYTCPYIRIGQVQVNLSPGVKYTSIGPTPKKIHIQIHHKISSWCPPTGC